MSRSVVINDFVFQILSRFSFHHDKLINLSSDSFRDLFSVGLRQNRSCKCRLEGLLWYHIFGRTFPLFPFQFVIFNSHSFFLRLYLTRSCWHDLCLVFWQPLSFQHPSYFHHHHLSSFTFIKQPFQFSSYISFFRHDLSHVYHINQFLILMLRFFKVTSM